MSPQRESGQHSGSMHASPEPSAWIVRYAHLIAPGAHVLDLACGSGRHARYLAALGCEVLAVDRDEAALAPLQKVPGVTTRVLDLEGDTWSLAGEQFDAIVVVNYLYRPHLPELLDALKPAGTLLYETFAAGNEAYGRPTNPAFLLQRNELIDCVTRAPRPLAVVAFEEGHVPGLVHGSTRGAVVQRVVAVGTARKWPLSLVGDTQRGESS